MRLPHPTGLAIIQDDAPAVMDLVVRAVRVPEDTPIVGLLQEIQHYWYDKEQRKNTRHRDPNRFSQLLLESQWQDDDER